MRQRNEGQALGAQPDKERPNRAAQIVGQDAESGGPACVPAAAVGLGVPLWLLVLVTLSGTMAMHIFVPALPVAGTALHAPAASMQQTITWYVIGLAAGQ
ncbi:MAG: hypothetical protein LBV14_12105, partial [Acidovorax sp.]|nr:hypothetical protein [Acidovorax sp.]